MDQHPVPQPITSYEFRLVGDMTLKQFGKLAAGIILALITYGINPPAFIKWPLVVLFAGIGLAMAFVPFEGRPIDIWIIAFFKRIYSPTLYSWQSKNKQAKPSSLPVPQQTVAPVTAPAVPKSAPTVAPITSAVTPSIPTPQPITASPPVSAPPKYNMPYIPKPPPVRPDLLHKRVEARFVTNMTIPAAPTMPNIIVGYLHSPDKKIIDNAIIEIRDTHGNPVRALKTNQLGHFQTATPLSTGSYEIEIEKEGFSFDIIKVNLEGKPLLPIEIISK